MRAPHQIDINAADILAGLLGLIGGSAENNNQIKFGESDALITLSVRSALDLYLQAKALPHGSEVIISAITHPDIAEILRCHGLVPVPVDLDFALAAPNAYAVQRAATPSTRAVIVAHLFGGVVNLEGIATLCRNRGWLLIEDCAQALGTGYKGQDEADLVLFSFGPLKTATALGGALAIVGDPQAFAQMTAIQRSYPFQPSTAFLKRLALYSLLRTVSHPAFYGSAYRTLRYFGYDPSKVMRGLTKSFNGAFDINRFRHRAAGAQIRFLKRRVSRLDMKRIRRRSVVGEGLAQALSGISRFGGAEENRTHWIFPITVNDPEAVLRALELEGIHAMPGLSNLAIIDPPRDRDTQSLNVARYALARSLLIPMPLTLDDDIIYRIARIVKSVEFGVGTA